MPQSPVFLDSLRIQDGNILITRDTSGNLTFSDVNNTTVTLLNLKSLKDISGVFIVGSGEGASHSTIQSALDDIPFGAGGYAIFIMAGSYTENLTINKDVQLFGFGKVTITSASTNTILITEHVSETPQVVLLDNLVIENTAVNGRCVNIEGAAGTLLGAEEIAISNSQLNCPASGSQPIRASVVNNVKVLNSSTSCHATSYCEFLQVSKLIVNDFENNSNFSLSFDNGGSLPSQSPQNYSLLNVQGGSVTTNFVSASSLTIRNSILGNFTVSGTQVVLLENSQGGDFSINGTSQVSFKNSTRGTLTGLGISQENELIGTLSFAAEISKTYSFPTPQADTNYFVIVEQSLNNTPKVVNKTTTGFDLEFAAPETTTLSFLVKRIF